MSTRAQLAIYKTEKDAVKKPADGCFLYRHSDGYPESVIPDILPFLQWFEEERGIADTSYCAARLLAHLIKNHDGYMEKINVEMGLRKKKSEFGDVLGYGVDTGIHGDIEFFYHISPDAVRVLQVIEDDPSTWKEIERHTFKNSGANNE